MVFSSPLFLFYFLPWALLLYYALPRRGKHLALTCLSYGFYGWANPLFLVLLLTSTVVDYACGLTIERRPAWTRAAVATSVVSNLSLLGFFKYFNFLAENVDALAQALGLPWLRLDLAFRITLPLGISFYTFQSMSYTLDIARGRSRALPNFIDFACYVSMFPQLVAGPIVRFSEVADQFVSRTHTLAKFARGVAFFSVGLAKKVLLANPCGKVADLAFEADALLPLDAWLGVVAYAFQIYFDFSGYSDMAIGLGLMLGFAFPKNFDAPYRSRSITEFWRRWHISLSTWLRDYLYIPLGGSHGGPARTYMNLAIVMLLGGLWHGAAWNFVVWGGLHGALLAFERAGGKRAIYGGLPAPLQVAVTFLVLLVTWVFFRAADLPAAMGYLASMGGLAGESASAPLVGGLIRQPYYLGMIGIAALVTWTCPQTWDWTRRLTWRTAWLTIAALAASMAALTTQAYNPFIYFIF